MNEKKTTLNYSSPTISLSLVMSENGIATMSAKVDFESGNNVITEENWTNTDMDDITMEI